MELTINHQLTFFEKPPVSLEEIVILHTQGKTLGIAVALNHQVIPKATWATTSLSPNDTILIIKATQGG